MAHNRNIPLLPAGAVLGLLRRGGPKTVVAGVLILIMLFMWLRVFWGHRPAAAGGAPRPQPTEAPAAQPPVKVTRLELPKTAGRHDALARDFFTRHDPVHTRRHPAGRHTGTDQEVPVIASRFAQEVIRRVARTLKLQAVLWSENPQAFINDQLMGPGGRLLVKDGPALFVFEVLQIHVNSVLVECDGVQLTLELAQFLEVVH